MDELDRDELVRRYGRAAAYREEADENTAFLLRLAGILFVIALMVLFGAYTVAQVTARDSAERIIARAIPSITDFDHAFAAHYDELVSSASSPSGVNGVALSAFPARVTLTRDEVLNRPVGDVRRALLLATADAVYRNGIDAFSRDGKPVKLGSASFPSGPWAFKTALRLLSPGVHRETVQAAKIALVAGAVLALLLLALAREYNRIVMYGAAVFIAAIPGLALSALIWLLVQVFFGSSSDPLVAGTSDITRDVAWYLILSYLVFCALGVALFILGLLVERIAGVVAVPRDPAKRREYST